jgi:hypothetical protein
MSEQSSQRPDPTPVQDPQAAGFPAEKLARDSLPPPGDPAMDPDNLGSPPLTPTATMTLTTAGPPHGWPARHGTANV